MVVGGVHGHLVLTKYGVNGVHGHLVLTKYGVSGVHGHLVLGPVSNEPLRISEGHIARSSPVALETIFFFIQPPN